jgi:hypothetical protein
MTNAAMQADYCDLKIIKTRKVIQVVLEIPQEAGDAFIAAFGLPRSDKNVPVAIARLNTVSRPAATATTESAVTTDVIRPKGGKLAQRAGIVCGEAAFHKFMGLQYPRNDWGPLKKFDEELTTIRVRELCGFIDSRAELDHNPDAARKFNNLMAEYNAWLSHG